MKKILPICFCFLLLSTPLLLAETMNFRTNYPAPFGAYDRILFVPRAALTNPCAPGTVYYVAGTNNLELCIGPVGTFESVLGPWRQSAPTQVTLRNTASFVGIGPGVPLARLHVFGATSLAGPLNVTGNTNIGGTLTIGGTVCSSIPPQVLQTNAAGLVSCVTVGNTIAGNGLTGTGNVMNGPVTFDVQTEPLSGITIFTNKITLSNPGLSCAPPLAMRTFHVGTGAVTCTRPEAVFAP